MNTSEIANILQQKFSDSAVQFGQADSGDQFLVVSSETFKEVCLTLRNDSALAFDFLRLITGVDWTEHISSVYHLYSYVHFHGLVLRVNLDRTKPEVPTVSDIWPTANWLERETYDMMGIVYKEHPELSRILLPLDWDGHPLRKNYEPPKEYHGIRHG